MNEIEEIIATLNEHKIKIVGDPVEDTSDKKSFYAFINVDRDKEGKQKPTNFQLRRVSENLAQNGIVITFIIIEKEAEDILATLKSALFRFFPEIIRNVFLSSEGKKIVVWLEPKKTLTKDQEYDVSSKVQSILDVLKVKLEAVKFTSYEIIPTRTACLNVIRLKAPLSQKNLQNELINRKFHIPGEDWLANILDGLRKSGNIIRKKDGSYVMTLSGLQSLGTAKNSKSPDVLRALEIGKYVE